MNGTEKIIAHIRADAQAQADAVLAEAEKKCAAVSAEYEAKAKDSYSARIRTGVKACSDSADSRERIAQMEVKKSVLALKQEMVSRSFEKAQEKIVALPEDRYVAFLSRLAAGSVTTGDEQLVFNARDKAAVGQKVADAVNAAKGCAVTVSDETGDFAGGLMLRRGNITVNCTVELLVELCRGEMSAELAGVLFG